MKRLYFLLMSTLFFIGLIFFQYQEGYAQEEPSPTRQSLRLITSEPSPTRQPLRLTTSEPSPTRQPLRLTTSEPTVEVTQEPTEEATPESTEEPTSAEEDQQQATAEPTTSLIVLPTSTLSPSPSPSPSSPPVFQPATEPTPTEIPALPTASVLQIPTAVATTAADKNITLTFADLDYEDVTLSGPADQRNFYLKIPKHWRPLPGSSFTLYYLANFSDLGDTQNLELSVFLDDIPIHQELLTEPGQNILDISLPDTWPPPTPEGYRITIAIQMPGECQEIRASSLTVLSQSFVNLVYQTDTPEFDLSLYPYPIYEESFLPNGVNLVFPAVSTDLQEAGGLSLAANLGSLTTQGLEITATTDLDWDATQLPQDHFILLGTPTNNHLILQLSSTDVASASIRPRQLELVTTGPAIINPQNPLTYTLQVTNTESVSVTNLHLISVLPFSPTAVSCQPQCRRETASQIGWEVASLGPGDTASYTVIFELASLVDENVHFTTELQQISTNEVINVSTLASSVQEIPNSTLIHSVPPSDLFFVLRGRAIPETDGIIQMVPSPWEPSKAILMVTGLTEEAVFKAGRALGTTAYFPGMKGPIVLVEDILDRTDFSTETKTTFSLAELGYEQIEVLNGVGTLGTSYRFYLPFDWNLTYESSIRLLFSHSPLLDPNQSSISVIFNRTPVASVALDESNIFTGSLISFLPPQSARPGDLNTLQVRVESLLDHPCPSDDLSHAWVAIDPNSTIHLEHVISHQAERLDLDYWPLPFGAEPSLKEVAFVLPEIPSAEEHNAAVQIAFRLGYANRGDQLWPSAFLGFPADSEVLSNYHLIVVGRPTRNPFLQVVNDILPQSFIPNSDQIRQELNNIVFRLPPDIDLGYLQLIPSQWSEEYHLLVVTGTSDLGLSWAVQGLLDGELESELEGDLALFQEGNMQAIDTRGLTEEGEAEVMATALLEQELVGTVTPTPLPTEEMEGTVEAAEAVRASPPSSSSRIPSWLYPVVGGGIGLIFLILGIAFWQHRRQKKRKLPLN